MELSLFDEVAEALPGPIPSDLGDVHLRWHRYGIKLWLDSDKPSREHYEAQVIGPDHVEGAAVLALEVGFHAEHPNVEVNDRVIAELLTCERQWRPKIGAEAVVGPFLGRRDVWRRISETWADPDLDSTDLAFEVAGRLGDYVTALEPVRRSVLSASGAGRVVGPASRAGRGASTRRATSSSGGRSGQRRSTSSRTSASAD